MTWLDSALDEMGLGPRWVRRVERADAAVAADPSATAGARAEAMPPVPDATVARRAPSPAVLDADGGVPQVAGRTDAPRDRAPMPAATRRDAEPAIARQAEPEPRRAQQPASPPADSAFDDSAWFDATPAAGLPSHGVEPAEPAHPAAVRSSVADLGWDELESRVSACESCRLCEKRTQTVFGVGDREADWMLIGEAPGENEDKQGEPFVGQAGKLLDSMLHALSLKRGENVYIANVIKCRPPGNRNPEPDEVARCEPYLQRQVALVKPKLIVALGRFAAQTLLKSDASIASMRGRVHQYEGVPVIVSYHPAYLLRSLPDKAKSWADLCLARDTYRDAGKVAQDGRTGDA
ncbi:uracil-DNA glycosylase [Burkholderia sp. Ac-20379]|uniref:uracil-DNA glycosylase n=1 Tax=Burkholderia sp. Ac-20379 TaxID=2703900 RepID=UPI00197D90E0|nr:uracil-DNA glycosylase [Burkholderia sp. Ac-20379]MBN3728987.1 uracil-DNA glycosylase [Burkholderia sp. Ac-20379]